MDDHAVTRAQKVAQGLGSLAAMGVPLWVSLSMCLGAAALGVVAGPPIVALASPEKAAELVGTHCEAVLSKRELEFERERIKLNASFSLALQDVQRLHADQMKTMYEDLNAVKGQVIVLRKDICLLRSQLDGANLDDCLE